MTKNFKPRYYVSYSHAYMGYVVRDSHNFDHNLEFDKVVPGTCSETQDGAQIVCNELNRACHELAIDDELI